MAQSKPDGDSVWVVDLQKARSRELLCCCLFSVNNLFLLSLSGDMPAPDDEKNPPAIPSDESESSSYETVEVEQDCAAWALAAATPKSAALPTALRTTCTGSGAQSSSQGVRRRCGELGD